MKSHRGILEICDVYIEKKYEMETDVAIEIQKEWA